MNVRSKLAFEPDKHFQPSLMFASKARAYPNEAPLRVALDLTTQTLV